SAHFPRQRPIARHLHDDSGVDPAWRRSARPPRWRQQTGGTAGIQRAPQPWPPATKVEKLPASILAMMAGDSCLLGESLSASHRQLGLSRISGGGRHGMTPFLQFRLWLREGPRGERVLAAGAAAVVVALVALAL